MVTASSLGTYRLIRFTSTDRFLENATTPPPRVGEKGPSGEEEGEGVESGGANCGEE
jgi:hypothetical protein